MSRLLCLLSSSLLVFATATLPAQQGKAPDARKAAEAAWQSQDWQAASASYRSVVEADPDDGEAWHRLGYALHALGKLDEALAAHERTATFPNFAPVGCYNAACVYALKGKADEAFTWLDKAVAKGFDNPDQFAQDSDMDNLRADPRFAKIVAKVEANATGRPRVQAFAQTVDRKRCRVAWFGRNGGAGQVSIEHAAVPWSDKLAAAVGSEKILGTKWRLGADFWTSLDSSLPLTVAGVDVPAGYYYLTLEQRDADTFVLALHDAAAVRKTRLDGFQADKLEGGIEVPMQHQTGDEVAERLAITIAVEKGSTDAGTLQIAFGPHTLTAGVTVELAK